jgi:hydrogenase maturation factor HypF (carbamoyltransferase family)
VDNRTDGVTVLIQGDFKTIDQFSNDVMKYAPPASMIKSIKINPASFTGYSSF